jgi:transcriptional regulator with XRE-family HTH domain
LTGTDICLFDLEEVMSLGKRVAKLREEIGMNQKQLADACGLTQATISRIESEQVNELKSEALKRLAGALGVTTDFLVGNPVEPNTSGLINSDPQAKFIFRGYEKLSDEGREHLKRYVQFLETQYKKGKDKK